MKKALLGWCLLAAVAAWGQSEKPLLLQKPALSRTQIVFVLGDELWSVPREGGAAIRLTSGEGLKTDPKFSPDGAWIAFTGQYDGNRNVYVMPATGGPPRQLTFHPGPNLAAGWTSDGKNVLFASARSSYSRGVYRLFTIPARGGFPAELPLPTAYEGSYSPDGSRIAYRPLPRPFGNWKQYRGGTAMPVWIANLANSSIEKVPRGDGNDFNPMWIGAKIYFLSDRNGPFTLFAYDTASRKVSEVLPNRGLEIKSASAGPGAIVYEQFGSLHLYDLASGREHAVEVRVTGDFPQARPHFETVARHILGAGISPTGVRAVFEAHGEILTAPAEKGDIRNLTNSPGVADRDPAWSPDGQWIAYFSDESSEYALHLRDQSGMGEVKKINLGKPPSFFYSPAWSPDSRKLAYTDKRLRLWYVELDKPAPLLIDTDTYETPERSFDPAWSPDSRWIVYTKRLGNHLRAVFVYSLETGKSAQITDGMSDARFAVFDPNGKSLYFTASTDVGPTTGWIDMSSIPHPVTRSVYVVVLRKDLPSPLAPESDEEKAAAAAKPEAGAAAEEKDKSKEKKQPPPTVQIDFENIGQRILALPIEARNYSAFAAGKTGELFLLETPWFWLEDSPPPGTLYKFDLSKRKTETLLAGIQRFSVSFNGEKYLYQKGEQWGIVPTDKPAKAGDGALKLEEMEVWVDPGAEWSQMYHEVWRIERDFFYDPNLHGLDLPATEKQYAAFLDGLASRNDLNHLFEQMLAQINAGHMFVFGGDIPKPKPVKVGLLGADYVIENGRYRFARVYAGENWNPELRAPLTQPGVNAAAGDYLLAVNGRELRAPDNLYSFFQETAGKQVVLKVGPDAEGAGAREVTVVPVDNELNLRNRAWIVDNIRKVDQMSGGRLAYVYLPDTAGGGYTNFNRYYFAQVGKQGAVVDERFNSGGLIADYIIEYMQRKLWSWWMTREGADFATPLDAIYGPKAMIINEFAGSGGDALPWLFRQARLGPLIGKRTWGGLVGIYDYPPLIDGGEVTAPRVAFFTTEGAWEVENHGVGPDIEVEFDPHAWREGRDPQLETAVAAVLEELKKNPPPVPRRPAFPNYYKNR